MTNGLVKKGFYFDFLLANEIMFEPQPLYVNNTVYFMTFTPKEGVGSSGSTDDPCGGNSAVNGSHYIYQFKLTSQGNTFTIGDFLNQSGQDPRLRAHRRQVHHLCRRRRCR